MASDQSFVQRARGTMMASRPGRAFAQGVGETFGMHYEGGVSKGFMGRKAAGGVFAAGKMAALGRGLFPVFTAYSAYSGYKEGGIMGATKNVAADAATWGAMRAAWSMFANPVTLGAAAVAGLGYGGYKLGEAAIAHEKRIKGLELGADVVDRFGTISTMRQRSLQAIQNSHLNGRGALGNEALIMSSPYLR